ncbi:MAG: hypothetical protein JWP59_408, partial [Massilia sp.]|nr:hypothetical protein [Massilia sp.]
MATSKDDNTKSTRGGTPEQHAEAGRQSHKYDTSRQTGTTGSGSVGSGTSGT